LEFTRQSFEMSLHFIDEQEQQVADLRATYEEKQPDEDTTTEKPPARRKRPEGTPPSTK
ncbi:MAG: XRE family transcriptional regulator, partial [Marinobacter sp.]|nr:XRE family transcriptional regulator [Marinobacter sp.]